MRTVAVSWDPAGGRFLASGTHRGQTIQINAPRLPAETRGPTGFSATELLLAGAGACSAWDVVEMLRKRRQEIASLGVSVEGEQAPEPPWRYEWIALHFTVAGRALSRPVLERVIRLSCLRYCSVLATVGGVARVEATLEILDEAGMSSGRQPVTLAETPLGAFDAPVPLAAGEQMATDED